MNDRGRLVGVVGTPPADLRAAITDAGSRSCQGDVETVLAAEPDIVVAVGDAAVLSVARAAPDARIVPVDVGHGFRSVPADSVGTAVEHVLEDEFDTQSHPVLRVEHDGEQVARAIADVTLLTADVAHISEYAISAEGDHVAQFRADGVIVATPAGSACYARRVGAPVVAPGTGVGAVAPIAPFATDPDHWILPLGDVRLTVERDETPVTLLADDREVDTVEEGEPVTIAPDATATVAVVPESRPRFP